MTFSYGADPTDSIPDAVRYLLQDTNEDRVLLQDEEISYEIGIATDLYGDDCAIMAAANCADVIAGRFARAFSISADGVSTSAGDLQGKYTTLAAALRERWVRDRGVGAEPFVGGIDWCEPVDLGVAPPEFGVGMDDNIRAGRQSWGGRGRIPEYGPLEGGYG